MKSFRNLLLTAILAVAVLAVPTVVFADQAVTITILHTNDMHGRFVLSDTAMGMDLIAAIYDEVENAILIDAGDTFHGLPFVNFNEGENAVLLMNMAGYSLMVPGNHDFNFGVDRLHELEQMANFDLLAANLIRNEVFVFPVFEIVEIEGVTIGFFGLVYPDTPVVTHPDNVAGLDFFSPLDGAEIAVSELTHLNVDVIVAVTHLGLDGSSWATQVAEAFPEIDIIIDGHSHTLIEDGLMVGEVLIAQSGAHAQNLGRVDITVSGGEIYSIAASVISREYALENFTPRADITAATARMNAELGEILDEVVGYSPVTFFGDSPEHRQYLRSQEVPIGNLVADAKRWGTGADLALTNSGGIRYHIHAGEVTKGDIIEVLAFFNYAVVVEITAAELWQALENGVSNMPGSGRFPQVSGFSFVFSFDEATDEDGRLISVMVNGQELDPSDTVTTFSLAINDFMAAGGDGYTVFGDLPRLGEFGTQDEILIAYMAVADLTAIGVEGRIVNAPVPYEPAPYVSAPYVPAPYVPAPSYVPTPYVPTPYVPTPYAPTPVIAPAPGTGTVVNCWYLNVRERGSVNAGIIGVLRAGDVVVIHETTDWNWHRIDAADVSGWVYGGFIEIN